MFFSRMYKYVYPETHSAWKITLSKLDFRPDALLLLSVYLTCHSDLNTEGLLTHYVLDNDGVDPTVRTLSTGNQKLGHPICIAHGHTFRHRHSIFQPDYSWHWGSLQMRVNILLKSVEKSSEDRKMPVYKILPFCSIALGYLKVYVDPSRIFSSHDHKALHFAIGEIWSY